MNNIITDYSETISIMFQRVGFEPRDYQIDIINRVINQFIDYGVNDVVINAPTGAGKSVIGMVTSMCMDYIAGKLEMDDKIEGESVRGAYILIHVNTLVEQYKETIKHHGNALVLMGARNYDCEVHDLSGEYCTFAEDRANGLINPHCFQCQFLKAKIRRNTANLIVSNYSYYMAAMRRNMLMAIYDECHLIDNAYVSYNESTIDYDYLNMHFTNKSDSKREAKIAALKQLLRESDDTNYIPMIENVIKLFNTDIEAIEKEITRLQEDEAYTANTSKQIAKLKRRLMYKGMERKKLKKYLIEGWEHVVDKTVECARKATVEALILTPIFIKNEIETINNNTKYRLYMSATNPKIYYEIKLNLKKFAYIQMDPIFPPTSKQLCLMNIGKINKTSMEDEQMPNAIIWSCEQIINKHKHEKGVIHIPSFQIGNIIYDALKNDYNIHYQQRGEKLVDTLEAYLADKKPCVLMTPSGYEGIDLKDDKGKWQIIVKAPYAMLGDKRIRYIANTYNDIYQIDTIVKIIQGAGRCTRSANDHSVTYCLDSNIGTCFRDKRNIWGNEFQLLNSAWLDRTW